MRDRGHGSSDYLLLLMVLFWGMAQKRTIPLRLRSGEWERREGEERTIPLSPCSGAKNDEERGGEAKEVEGRTHFIKSSISVPINRGVSTVKRWDEIHFLFSSLSFPAFLWSTSLMAQVRQIRKIKILSLFSLQHGVEAKIN